jgi:hypothetical protein
MTLNKTQNVGRMPAQTSFTDTELNAQFPNGLVPQSVSDSDRSGGIMKDTAVKALIASNMQSGVIPNAAAKDVNPDIYHAKVKKVLADAKKEYVFYNDRYNYSLQQVFNNIRSGYTANTSDAQAAVQKWLILAATYNTKLNDLIQITKGMSDNMLSSSDQMNASIVEFNKKMTANKEKLDYQGSIIKSNQATTKINKEMMKYAEEKGRYNDNLLKMYSFLNVVAFGLLIYIYRASA